MTEPWVASYNQCWKKRVFKTLKRAKSAARVSGKKHDVVLRPYCCNICGKYHLTSRAKR